MTHDLDARCVFCRIVDGSVPSWTVHEDDRTLAFLDINPASPGHTLVIPKSHSEDLLDADADTVADVMRSARAVAELLDARLSPEGLTLFQANRPAGWQDVFHLHVHVVPRWVDDDLVKPWTPLPATPDSLESVAARLRA